MDRITLRLFLLLVLTALLLRAGDAETLTGASSEERRPEGAVGRLGTTAFWQGNTLNMAFTGRDRTVVTAGVVDDKVRVRVWDFDSGRELRSFSVSGEEPPGHWTHRSTALSPDGRIFARNDAQSDGSIRLWDIATGRLLRALDHVQRIDVLAFSADGQVLASVGDGSVRLWDVATGKLRQHLPIEARLWYQLAFSPDGLSLALRGTQAALVLCDTKEGGKSRYWRDEEDSTALALAPDGRTIATGGQTGVRVWDPATGKVTQRLENPLPRICALAFSPDGKTLVASGYAGGVRLWHTATGKEWLSFPESGSSQHLAFSPDGRFLGSAGTKVSIWDLTTGKQHRPNGHNDSISGLAISSDGKWAVTRASDGVRVWDLATAKEHQRFAGPLPHLLGSVHFAPDSRTLAWPVLEKVLLADAITGQKLSPRSPRTPIQSSIYNVSLAGQFFVTVDHAPVLHDLRTGQELWRCFRFSHALPEPFVPPDEVSRLVISPNGRMLASSHSDHSVSLWDVATGEELQRFEERASSSASLAFSPDGRTLAIGENRGTILLNVVSGSEILCLGQEEVLAMVFSPDGRTVASGHPGGTVCLRETATGKERRCLKGHQSSVLAVAFTPDGKRLVSGSNDTTCLIWDATGLLNIQPASVDTPEAQWNACWAALAGDADRAFRTFPTLAAARRTLPRLRELLIPVPRLEEHQIARLLADLDSDDFDVRERATEQLVNCGDGVEQPVRRFLPRARPEAGRRAAQVLERIQAARTEPVAEQLRELRAVELLEYLGTPDARRLLETLATGAPEARLTREARASLGRLAPRP
jgi:WD40 repeat protein